jgi:uncharacterized DUF497 family protein
MITVTRGEFEWDKSKAQANLRKHGVAFEEAISAFEDERALYLQDVHHPERMTVIGMSNQARLLFVVHVEIENEGRGQKIRVISARRGNRTEALKYTGSERRR